METSSWEHKEGERDGRWCTIYKSVLRAACAALVDQGRMSVVERPSQVGASRQSGSWTSPGDTQEGVRLSPAKPSAWPLDARTAGKRSRAGN